MSKVKALNLKIEPFYRRNEGGSHNGVSPLGRRILIDPDRRLIIQCHTAVIQTRANAKASATTKGPTRIFSPLRWGAPTCRDAESHVILRRFCIDVQKPL